MDGHNFLTSRGRSKSYTRSRPPRSPSCGSGQGYYMSSPATPYRSPAPFMPSYYDSPRGGSGRFEVSEWVASLPIHTHTHTCTHTERHTCTDTHTGGNTLFCTSIQSQHIPNSRVTFSLSSCPRHRSVVCMRWTMGTTTQTGATPTWPSPVLPLKPATRCTGEVPSSCWRSCVTRTIGEPPFILSTQRLVQGKPPSITTK